MSRATPDDQLKFLLSCVRHSNNGKIEFIEVARECGVVSKGAAAKRYERLLKANGIHPNGGLSDRPISFAPKQKSKADVARIADAKRRKIEGSGFQLKTDDEDDIRPYFKPEPFEMHQIKSEPGTGLPQFTWSPMSAPGQQPFFPRPPLAQMVIHNPYGSAYPPVFNNVSNRFPYVASQPLQAEPSHIAPRPNQTIQAAVRVPNRDVPPSSSLLVSEEQIDNMFNEFCRENLFKSPKPDTCTTADITTPAIHQPVQMAQNESQLSPRTIDGTAAISLEDPVEVASIKQEPITVAEAVPATPPTILIATANTMEDRPTGTGFENSIVITD